MKQSECCSHAAPSCGKGNARVQPRQGTGPGYNNGVQDDQLLSFSNGWLQTFQKRHDFRHMSTHGESGSVNTGAIPAQRDAIRERLNGVSLADNYNMDEFGLFYCLVNDRSIARRQVVKSKKSKTRVTVALTCNVDGSEKNASFSSLGMQISLAVSRRRGGSAEALSPQ